MSGTDWKSFTDQLQILKDRGLTVGDDTRAISYLEKIGYYCLSGYWYPFRSPKAQPVGLVFREDLRWCRFSGQGVKLLPT